MNEVNCQPKVQLFVVADDLGYCEHRNRGIFECANVGSIDTASLLVTGRCAESAVKLFQNCGTSFKLGLHFNITEGNGLSPRSDVKTLIQPDQGHFFDKLALRSAAERGVINPDDVRCELSAQVKQFWNITGYLPTRVDGHQHVHVIGNGVSQAFAECLHEFGNCETRLPLDAVVIDGRHVQNIPENVFRFNQQVIQESKHAKDMFEHFGVRHAQAFIGLTLMGQLLTMPSLREATDIANLLVACPGRNHCANKCELMVHPGYSSSATTCNSSNCGCIGAPGPDSFSLSNDRSSEMTLLKSEEFRQIYRQN